MSEVVNAYVDLEHKMLTVGENPERDIEVVTIQDEFILNNIVYLDREVFLEVLKGINYENVYGTPVMSTDIRIFSTSNIYSMREYDGMMYWHVIKKPDLHHTVEKDKEKVKELIYGTE